MRLGFGYGVVWMSLLASACASERPQRRPPPPKTWGSPPPIAAAPPPANPPYTPVGNYRPAASGTIACGSGPPCVAGQQACCASTTCIPLSTQTPNISGVGLDPPVHNALNACTSLHGSDVVLCEHSGQCGGDDRCVPASLAEMSMSYCRPANLASQESEQCVDDRSCKTPGTICSGGTCVSAKRSVTCAGMACPARSICWETTGRAVCSDVRPSEELWRGVACDGPEDCLSGQKCCDDIMVQHCSFACYKGPIICADHKTTCELGDVEGCKKCGAIAP